MLFITSNNNKFSEAQRLIPGLEQRSLELDEIQSLDLREIVEHKLAQAFSIAGKPCIVEDVSLEIADLGGMPGPFVKYFAKALGQEGVARLSKGSVAKALCCIGYHDSSTTHLFIGEMTGTITTPQGVGFGFDVIFVPQGETKRVSELGTEYKQEHSHRARALKKLLEHLNGR